MNNADYYRPCHMVALFGVRVETIKRREQRGQLPKAERTTGGHRRWLRSVIDPLVPAEKRQALVDSYADAGDPLADVEAILGETFGGQP